jgi:hypothetical protein
VELFSGVTSAQLTFLYQGTLFTVSLFESELVPDPGEVSFFARQIYAQNVVPEPSSLLLLMSGLALSIARARARR